MAWTWNGVSAIDLLNKYPSIAEIPEFVSRWPGIKEQLTSPQAAELRPEAREALKSALPQIKVTEPR